MSRAPPLLRSNRFSVLKIHDTPESKEIDEDAQPTLPATAARPPRQPERRLSPKLVIRSLDEGPNCIMIPAQLKTTDTMELAATEAMVDTGATGDFIDQDFVDRSKLPTRKLSQPIPVYNVDGTPNEAGSIDKVVDVIMTYNGHYETRQAKHDPRVHLAQKTQSRNRLPSLICQNDLLLAPMLHRLPDGAQRRAKGPEGRFPADQCLSRWPTPCLCGGRRQ